jgi:hypothetical protein
VILEMSEHALGDAARGDIEADGCEAKFLSEVGEAFLRREFSPANEQVRDRTEAVARRAGLVDAANVQEAELAVRLQRQSDGVNERELARCAEIGRMQDLRPGQQGPRGADFGDRVHAASTMPHPRLRVARRSDVEHGEPSWREAGGELVSAIRIP